MKSFLSVVIAATVSVSSAAADVEILEFRQAALNNALKRVTPALVSVRDGFGAGSGVVVSDNGIVLTAAHVVESRRRRSNRIRVVFPDGSSYRASVLGMNRTADAAMLKIDEPFRKNDGQFPHVELGSSSNLERGEWCFALGHPGGFNPDRGAPVRLGRVLSVGYRTVVSDCAIVLGDSGGPLFDLSGRLIGIHSMITEVIVENRHVAVDVFRRDSDRMESGQSWGRLNSRNDGLVKSLFFGVNIRWKSFTPVVSFVDRRSPAWEAGIRAGDVLQQINGQSFADALGLNTLLGQLAEDQQIEVQFERTGRERVVTATTGARPSEEDLADIRDKVIRPSNEYRRELLNQLTAFRKVGRFEKRSPDEVQNFDLLVDASRDSVVRIRAFGDTLALGTIVSSDGYVLTKASELENAIDPDCILSDGRKFKIREVAVDRSFDLMLFKINAQSLNPVEWSSLPPPPVGRILITTNAEGTPILPGVVSVANRKLPNSQKGFLGVELQMENRDEVSVRQVLPSGAAERSGIQVDDVILSINESPIMGIKQMISIVGDIPPNGRVSMRIRRNNRERVITATLSPRFVAETNDVMLERYSLTQNLGKFASAHNSGFPEAIQHDTDLFPNQCGGPVFDITGRAIGLNIARSARVVSYAIPAHAVQAVFAELKKQDKQAAP